MELSYGAALGDEELRNVRNALRTYPVVDQDQNIAQRAVDALRVNDESY